MSAKPLQFTTPAARLVGGSLYEPRTEDANGKPLVYKTGAKTGQPRPEYSFGVAIPKTPGCTHWANETWGRPIWDMAHAAFPAGEAQHPAFAWKIQDGDSQVPNKKGNRNCDREGHPGHWVLWFSGSIAPRVYKQGPSAWDQVTEPFVKLGYWVQVFATVTDNKPSESPGIYLNHSMVGFIAFDSEIFIGPDVSTAGFGQGVVLPPSASATPPTVPMNIAPPGSVAAPAAPGAVAPLIPMPGAPGSVPAPGIPAPTVAVPAPLSVAPNPAVLVPPAAPAAPVASQYRMTGAYPLEQMRAAGWSDEALLQAGHMIKV